VTVPIVLTVKVGADKNETLNRTTGVGMIFGLNGANTTNAMTQLLTSVPAKATYRMAASPKF